MARRGDGISLRARPETTRFPRAPQGDGEALRDGLLAAGSAQGFRTPRRARRAGGDPTKGAPNFHY